MASPFNITSLTSTLTGSLNKVTREINSVQTQLATGKGELNPAYSGEITRLSSQVNKYDAATKGIGQAQNVVTVGLTGLQTATDLIQQMEALALQATSGTMSATDLTYLNTTFNQLAKQISSAATNSSVNGVNLLTATAGFSVLCGVDTTTSFSVSGMDLTSIAATCTGLSITSASVASSAITSLTSQLTLISAGQSSLSASNGGLAAQATQAQSLSDGLQNTIDSINNIDPTALQARLQALNNQQAIDYYLITQMNQAAAAMLAIFR
jgi:flagellin-like hook-associated protein FlgL